jgi:hypothetical protein
VQGIIAIMYWKMFELILHDYFGGWETERFVKKTILINSCREAYAAGEDAGRHMLPGKMPGEICCRVRYPEVTLLMIDRQEPPYHE